MLFEWSQVPVQVGLVSAAFLLCCLIGFERQFQHKAAGIRTHALVGVGSCVFTLISAQGFAGMVDFAVTLDPSRIAAQIVSGIGFLGAGVIFVNRNVVRGLTTAASIWLAAAVGMACGAGMLPLAVFAAILHFAAVLVVAPLSRFMPMAGERSTVYVTYEDGRGVLRELLRAATAVGSTASLLRTETVREDGVRCITAQLRFRSGPPLAELMDQLAAIKGVIAVERRHRNDL